MTEKNRSPQNPNNEYSHTLNEQQRRLIHRLKEVGINTNRFLKVGDGKLHYTNKHPEGEYLDKAAFETDFQNNLYGPEDLGTYPRWGIIGKEGLTLLDFDKKEIYDILDKRLPKTLEITSPRHGLPHRYYKVIGGQITNNKFHIPDDVDERGLKNASGEIRSNNHYLVAPGTTIRYQDLTTDEWKLGEYTITNDIPIATLTYAEFMAAVEPYLLDRTGEKRLTDEMLTNGVSTGVRHDTIFRYACRLMGDNPEGGHPATITLDILRRYNQNLVNPSVEDDFIRRVIKQACEYAAKESGAPVEQIAQLGFKEIHKQQSGQDQSLSEQPQQIENEATTTQEPITLKEVKETFKKWLYLEGDDEVIDVIIAGSIDRRVKGDPLWLLLISPSGGTKTEIVRNIKNKDIYTLDSVTAHSFISGKIDKDDDGNPIPVTGILKEIDGKILIIKDFTVLLGKRREDRDEIFSQLRSLYDGYIEFAFGTSPTPIRIEAKIGLIAAVTPAIDAFTKVYLQLGERFLKIRHHPDAKKATHKALSNLGKEDQMRTEITAKTTQFLATLQINDLPPIPEAYSLLIEDIALTVAILRTPVPMNIWKFEMNNTAEPITEYPTRLVKQLMKLAYSLSIIRGKTEVTIEEIKTVKRVARDTCVPNRVLIIDALMPKTGEEAKSFTTREIAQKSKIPLSTCWRELKEMEIPSLVEYNKTEQLTGTYNTNTKHTPENDGWKLLNIELANILEKREIPTISATIPCFTGVPPEYTIKINKVNDNKCEQQSIPIGYVSETPQNKPRWFVKEISPGAKCECGKYAVTKEIITPQHELIKRCASCLKKLQKMFDGAEFFPAYPNLEGREA